MKPLPPPLDFAAVEDRDCVECRQPFAQARPEKINPAPFKFGPIHLDRCPSCLLHHVQSDPPSLDILANIRRQNYGLAFRFSASAG